jgi:hypothetical protein
MLLLPDGSILFDKPKRRIVLDYYKDPDNPCRYIPEISKCKHSQYKLKENSRCTVPCHIWTCNKYQKEITLGDCKKCQSQGEDS